MGKHTPAAQQRRLVELWRAQDTSMAAFARDHDVHPVTFGTWVERYPPQPTFLPVAVVEADDARHDFTVRVCGHQLHFDDPPPPAWFAALLRELGSC